VLLILCSLLGCVRSAGPEVLCVPAIGERVSLEDLGEGAHVTPSHVNCRLIPPTCLPGATNHAACRNLRARSSFPINDESPRDSSSRGRPPVRSRSGKASGRRSRRRRRGESPGASRFRRCPANEELVRSPSIRTSSSASC
jgi:hypothetical protein